MALSPRLELKQGQSLVMTPQLQQAIKLLQMSNLELQAFVESELEKNPLLERDEKREAQGPAGEAEERDVASAIKDGASAEERLATLDTDLDNVYQGESRADAANRGIAAHRAERVEVVRKQQGFHAHARAGQRRLGAGVAATDHDYIETVRKLHGKFA